MEVVLSSVKDRGELVSLMEPLLLSSDSPQRPALTELAFQLVARSSALQSRLSSGVRDALAELVRNTNCYYSNLIEGHNIHPVDIERALSDDYSRGAHKRNLQLEARAHVNVQSWIDHGGLSSHPTSKEAILEIHRRLYEGLPSELALVENPASGQKIRVVPGEIRRSDAKIGKHVAVSPGAVSQFLERFEQVYSKLTASESVLESAAAHHRLLWIHPFLDGNGRVARLVSVCTTIGSAKDRWRLVDCSGIGETRS